MSTSSLGAELWDVSNVGTLSKLRELCGTCPPHNPLQYAGHGGGPSSLGTADSGLLWIMRYARR
jgi:hypothetical protein